MIKINDNINFHYIPMKKLKTSTIGIYIHRPLCEEEVSKTALLSRVLKRGCMLARDRVSLEAYLDELYGGELKGGTYKKGEDNVIYMTIEAISEKYTPSSEPLFEKMTELIMSVVFDTYAEGDAFCKEYVKQEKKNALDRIESAKNDKRTYASQRCVSEVCRGGVYALQAYGTADGINEIDEKSLYEYYKKIITSSRIDIYVSGECDSEKTIKLIKKLTPKNVRSKTKFEMGDIIKRSEDVRLVEEKMDVTQGKLSLGFLTNVDGNSEDYYALMVANSIFGAGAHSKLFNNVREKLSLCYYAGSTLERNKGFMIVNAGIEFENYQKAYDEILVQLDEVKAGNVSELEYVSSINAIVNSLKSCYDDQYAMQSFHLSENISGRNLSLEDCIEKIKNVTVEDAVRAFQNVKLDTVYFLKGVACDE